LGSAPLYSARHGLDHFRTSGGLQPGFQSTRGPRRIATQSRARRPLKPFDRLIILPLHEGSPSLHVIQGWQGRVARTEATDNDYRADLMSTRSSVHQPESQLTLLHLLLHRVGLAPTISRWQGDISVFAWQEDDPIDAISQNAVTAAIERYFWERKVGIGDGLAVKLSVVAVRAHDRC
jgi:hypothetical protein